MAFALVAVNTKVEVLQLLNASVAPSVTEGTGNALNVTFSAGLAILEHPVAFVSTTV